MIVLNPLNEKIYIDDYASNFIKTEFSKVITENIFFINISYLKQQSDIVEFKINYNYSPQNVCIEYYNNKNYYPLILLVNNCSSIFMFHNDYYKQIYVPKIDAIASIISSTVV